MVVLTSVQVVDILGVLQTNINTTITLADIIIAINRTATPAKQNDHLAHLTQQPNGSYILSPRSGFRTMVETIGPISGPGSTRTRFQLS
ncbi:hypothetical protein J4E85_000894 [Alternaria conjuncta]|uniref:uncharacterized protein n=1 Tax=Alternaria conjuncta TaxID=181017 RepID=UPI00221EC3D0|nr:uncharacterized protein J4E85_000894 [Alternaria conjuncta]KAI4938454.1 hypothetical protein J4E85_000894 [Alternaria conjuncta]